ncbi:MAG: arginine--tRNA ligase, partial [Myxococcota bacterium]
MSEPLQTTRDIQPHLKGLACAALQSLGCDQEPTLAEAPNPEMGDLGFPCFPFAKILRRSPAQIAQQVVEALTPRLADEPLIAEVRAVGPYVNFRLALGPVLAVVLRELNSKGADFGCGAQVDGGPIMVEFSSPNTNKPQHLGHVRNNLLGQSLSRILSHYGHTVIRANLINDRGIAICKSMLAYERFGEQETPKSAGIKGDHLVGKYYVLYAHKLGEEYNAWQQTTAARDAFAAWAETPKGAGKLKAWAKDHGGPLSDDEALPLFFKDYEDIWFNTHSELGRDTRDMLHKWEEGDAEVRALWAKLNGWVEDGFWQTYARLGVSFERLDRESETWQLGRDIAHQGLERGVFEKADNGAIVFDLNRIGHEGHKAILRGDGTSLYITQDLGTAQMRFEAHDLDQLIYVVGNEQDHHFRVLFGVLGALDSERYTDRCHHLSYGMINLPHGRMKSREGTVVDADDLMQEMVDLAAQSILERYQFAGEQRTDNNGKLLPVISWKELMLRSEAIGMGALKYYILNYTPRSPFTFDPEESLK